MNETIYSKFGKILRLIQEYAAERYNWLNIGTAWVTEGAKAWMETNILPTDKVLEYGAGRSSIFFARKAQRLTIVEGSPDWTLWVMFYLYDHPELMKKVRIYFCPTEWNPTFKRARRYWTENRAYISENDIYTLERDLSKYNDNESNVVLFDGNIRPLVFVHQCKTMDFLKLDVIIIDNTEDMFNSDAPRELIPNEFVRLDMYAREFDDIPKNQKGKHVTSIFVRESRLPENYKELYKDHILERDELAQHQHFNPEYNVKDDIATISEYLDTRVHNKVS